MNFKFKPISTEDDVVYSSELYYDLFDGGCINPSKMLDDVHQAKLVEGAVEIIEEFLSQAQASGHLEEV